MSNQAPSPPLHVLCPPPLKKRRKRGEIWRPYLEDQDQPTSSPTSYDAPSVGHEPAPGPSWRYSPPSPPPPPPTSSPSSATYGEDRAPAPSSQPTFQTPAQDSRPASLPPLFPEDHFQLIKIKTKNWTRGPIKETSYRIKITKAPSTTDRFEQQLQLAAIMEAAFRSILQQAPDQSTAQIYAVNDNLYKSCLSTCRKDAKALTFEHLAEQLTSVLQSDESVKLEDTQFHLSTFQRQPTVGGLRDRCQSTRLEHSQQSRYFFDPMQDSYKLPQEHKNLCVAYVLLHDLFKVRNPGKQWWAANNYIQSRQAKKDVIKLIKETGLDPDQAPFNLEQLKCFSSCLPAGVGVNFFEDNGPPVLQIGAPSSKESINIFLCYSDGDATQGSAYHAFGIISLPGFMDCRAVCPTCFKGARSLARHKCPQSSCPQCQYINCKNKSTFENIIRNRVTCSSCNIFFHTQLCYEAHLQKCGEIVKCKLCGQRVNKCHLHSHPCEKPYCQLCKQYHSTVELCYASAQPWKPARGKPQAIWYADTETQVDPSTKEHHANLLILQRQDCDEFVEFKGPKTMELFVDECMKKDSQFKNSYICFHNAAGFDAHLWWRELWRRGVPPKNIIRKQQKIISMQMRGKNNIKCRDSLQFIPGTPLAAFGKMFGLDYGKGDFPHALNTPQWVQFGHNIVYKEVVHGQEHRFPLLKYFHPEQKRAHTLSALKSWHASQVEEFNKNPNLKYIPEQELISYCRQDVTILKKGFEKYRATWLEQYPDLEPLESLTFPSYNNRIFREIYMPSKSLGLLPPNGFEHKNQPNSVKAMAWIAWMEREHQLERVRTSRHAFEATIGGHRVDGLGYRKSTGEMVVLQFHGCRWHGHQCQKRTPNDKDYLDNRQERTRDTDQHLEWLKNQPNSPVGVFDYLTIYECEFEKEQARNQKMKKFICDYTRRYCCEPLRPRDALRGGRTNAIKHRIQVPPGFRLLYLDFNSLYPAVNYGVNGETWPIGYPDIYIGKDLELAPDDPSSWFGLVKLTIIPPRQLRHPVIGELRDDRFVFHLCTTCAAAKAQGYCIHTDEERAIKGVYFTGEIQLALQYGYRIKSVQELWHWPPERRSKSLFKELIRDQYKNKVKASSLPSDPKQLEQFIHELWETFGIHIPLKDFAENPSLRNLAKFSLNNIWGFLGKRNDEEETVMLQSYMEFLKLENDPNTEITRVLVSDDEEWAIVCYRKKPEPPSPKGSIVLACLTTAYARIALYKVLAEYPEEVLYFDTDSIFLLLGPGREPPQISNQLGRLKDEILEEFGPRARITHFYSIGPKSYTYHVQRDGVVLKSVVRMKGINFSAEACSVVDPDNIKGLVDRQHQFGASGVVRTVQHHIGKKFLKASLYNASFVKKIEFTSAKRWIIPGPNPTLDTLPYGFSQS